MVVVCQQPNYFPWLGYLEQIARADAFIFLDSVQWIRTGRQHRARVLPQNPLQVFDWLTIPVHGHCHREKIMAELEIDVRQAWARTHWRTLQTIYGRRPYFKSQLEPLIRPWLESMVAERSLTAVTESSVRLCCEILGLKPKFFKSSELSPAGRKTERLLELCRSLNATSYYSGLASTKYFDLPSFRAHGIEVRWQHWRHPEYDQGRQRRQTHLSFLDALANVPVEQIQEWIQPNAASFINVGQAFREQVES